MCPIIAERLQYEMLDWEVHQIMDVGPFNSGEMAFRREMAGGGAPRLIDKVTTTLA